MPASGHHAWPAGHAMEHVMRSIVSYPERGPYGSSSYPGNCSGHLIGELVTTYNATSLLDPAEGSGTARDLANARDVMYDGFDLRDGYNLEERPLIAVAAGQADLVFFHPPYYRIVQYSGVVWGDKPHPGDLSHETNWQQYLTRLYRMVRHCLTAVAPTGHLAILIGDVRQEGSYFSAQAQLLKWFRPALIEAVIIKEQHGVRSSKTAYSGRLIRIEHEYCIVIRGSGGRNG